MSKKRRTTKTADKLLTIIADSLNINKDYIMEESTFEGHGTTPILKLGLTPKQKSRILKSVAEKFDMKITPEEIKNIQTVYNSLQFVEGSKNFKIPA